MKTVSHNGSDFLRQQTVYLHQIPDRYLQKRDGRGCQKIIDDFAILEIKVLLQSTGLTIQEIADRLGFPDQSYLGRYFKRHEGMSPKEYQSKYSI